MLMQMASFLALVDAETGRSSDALICLLYLHFNGVALLQRAVQYTGGVNDLPSQVLVVQVPHEQTLCGEGIGLHIDVCTRDLCIPAVSISQRPLLVSQVKTM